jgi:hypothetical protein
VARVLIVTGWLALATGGCGRFNFTALGSPSGDANGDASGDTAGDAARCPGCRFLFVTDRTVGANRVVLLADTNNDGDAMDPGERIDVYTVNGGATGLNNAMSWFPGPSHNIYVADNPGTILRLNDTNGDRAISGSEAHVFYTGPLLTNVQDVVVDQFEQVYAADAGGGVDQVVMLFDANGDGDAMDAGEAVSFAMVSALKLTIASGAPTVLFTQESNRMSDENDDGDAKDGSELVFYGVRAAAMVPLGVDIDPLHPRVYVIHAGASTEITVLEDMNASGSAQDPGEATLAGTFTSSNAADIAFDQFGQLYTIDLTDVIRLTDINTDGIYERHTFATGFQSLTRIHGNIPWGNPGDYF